MSELKCICIIEDSRESENNYNSLVNSALVTLNHFPIDKYLKSTVNTLRREYDEYAVDFNWPRNEDCSDIDLGFVKPKLEQDYNDMQCRAMTHYKLWDYCVESDSTLLILEDSVRFTKRFKYDKSIKHNIYSINHPKGCIENWEVYTNQLIKSSAIVSNIPTYKPSYNLLTTPNAVSYIIKPEAAIKLILNVDEYGLWPVEMMLNRQLVDNIGCSKVFYTRKMV